MQHIVKRAWRRGMILLALAVGGPSGALAHGGHGAPPVHHHLETGAADPAAWLVLGLAAVFLGAVAHLGGARRRRAAVSYRT